MKKIIVSIALLVFSLSFAYSQTDSTKFNLVSKRGFYFFPEKGDWSVAISATPFFEYFGNMIGNKNYYYSSSSNGGVNAYQMPTETPSFAFTAQNPGTVYLKYFYEDNKAYRFKLMFGYSTEKDNMGSGQADPADIYLKETALALGVYFGQEFILPIKSRIRGYYGYEVGGYTLPYIGELYDDPTLIVVGSAEYANESNSYEDFTEKGGSTLGFTGNGLIGVEWFFAPKVSLGGEMGLGFNYSTTSKRKYESGNNKIIIDSGSSSFAFQPFASGDLVLHLYF